MSAHAARRTIRHESNVVVDLGLAAGPHVELGGVNFLAWPESSVVQYVMAELRDGRGGRIVTPNVDILRQLRRRPELRRLLQDAVVVPDGMPVIWAGRIRGSALPERVSGASLVWSLSEAAERDGRSIFLLGGSPGAAEAAERALVDCYPSLRIVGHHCPPWGFEHQEEEMETIRDVLRRERPDLVYVALGFPKQEIVAEELRRSSPTSWFLGCGAALSFAGELVKRAPTWTQRLGLEWIHRLIQEPRRLATRYLVHGIPFALRLLASAGVDRVRARLERGARG